MSDIVQRLRDESFGYGVGHALLMQEGAAEIERLREDRERAGTFGEIMAKSVHRHDAKRLRKVLAELEAASAEVYRISERQTVPWARLRSALASARTALASVDTHPEGGDATQIAAPFMSGAVAEGETPTSSPTPSQGKNHA